MVIKGILKEKNVDFKKFELWGILVFISNVKNELIIVSEYIKEVSGFYDKMVGEVYEKYEKKFKKN